MCGIAGFLLRDGPADYALVLSAMRRGQYQLGYTSWLADFSDASNFLDLLRSGNPGINLPSLGICAPWPIAVVCMIGSPGVL